eukprot:GDKH01001156.1.p1 GENE.GDKH01001156.1~~GDKH01001156.1.p1  ORF type:complete len:155 (+),score=12.78 GDKH01001156.1:123-587(+)
MHSLLRLQRYAGPRHMLPRRWLSFSVLRAAEKQTPSAESAGASAPPIASKVPPPGAPDPERDRVMALSEKARQSQRIWDMAVPEKNWTLTSPITWVLLVVIIVLHFYNEHQDSLRKLDTSAEDRERELRKKAEEAREQRRQEAAVINAAQAGSR